MPLADSFFGWFVILMLYVIIGILAGAGSVFISQKIFKGANERRFYAFFLFVIAGFYAAFVAHFGDSDAWRTELTAVALFSLLSFLGTFYSSVLAMGYLIHGAWDIVHELNQTFGIGALNELELTTVPMLYGVFCLTYDLIIAGYCVYRRKIWAI